jgi:methionyl aminopeptidase
MVLAIEVMYALGNPEVVVADDGWTIATQDGKISALFEETVAVTADGPFILTQ